MNGYEAEFRRQSEAAREQARPATVSRDGWDRLCGVFAGWLLFNHLDTRDVNSWHAAARWYASVEHLRHLDVQGKAAAVEHVRVTPLSAADASILGAMGIALE